MRSGVSEWFARRTSTSSDWRLPDILARKDGLRVDVILPALNEQETVGRIVGQIRTDLMAPSGRLVDDLVVIDSGSDDQTAQVAATAGARVIHREQILPDLAVNPGKGEAMWRALADTSGDIVVFIDADLTSFTSDYVVALVGPLVADASISLVKSVYDRPLISGGNRLAAGGGRVTEIMARPLLNALWPELAGVAQPLAGEYAARRTLLEALPFPTGYGVDIGLLIDTFTRIGIDGIAQVDLGERGHRHQDAAKLAEMSAQVLHAALIRADPERSVYRPAADPSLPMFSHGTSGLGISDQQLPVVERPPMTSFREYPGPPG